MGKKEENALRKQKRELEIHAYWSSAPKLTDEQLALYKPIGKPDWKE